MPKHLTGFLVMVDTDEDTTAEKVSAALHMIRGVQIVLPIQNNGKIALALKPVKTSGHVLVK